jgi:hypothetical protein
MRSDRFCEMDSLGAMFTPEDRDRPRDTLIAAARADERITSAALTGSAALGLRTAGRTSTSPSAWWPGADTEHAAVHHVDVNWGDVLLRVFLLASTLQVNLAFWPQAGFGAIAPPFRLLLQTGVAGRSSPA